MSVKEFLSKTNQYYVVFWFDYYTLTSKLPTPTDHVNFLMARHEITFAYLKTENSEVAANQQGTILYINDGGNNDDDKNNNDDNDNISDKQKRRATSDDRQVGQQQREQQHTKYQSSQIFKKDDNRNNSSTPVDASKSPTTGNLQPRHIIKTVVVPLEDYLVQINEKGPIFKDGLLIKKLLKQRILCFRPTNLAHTVLLKNLLNRIKYKVEKHLYKKKKE